MHLRHLTTALFLAAWLVPAAAPAQEAGTEIPPAPPGAPVIVIETAYGPVTIQTLPPDDIRAHSGTAGPCSLRAERSALGHGRSGLWR